MTHTPGPWKAIKGFGPLDSPDTDPERWNVVAAANDHEYLIATIENGQPGDCLKTEGHTAHLIAGAPELLTALKWDAEQIYAILSSDHGGDIPSRIIAAQAHVTAIRAAVAKAEGRS